jgi:hypothetical protein
VRESENTDRDSVFHSLRNARMTPWHPMHAQAATRRSPSDASRPRHSLKIQTRTLNSLCDSTDRQSLVLYNSQSRSI